MSNPNLSNAPINTNAAAPVAAANLNPPVSPARIQSIVDKSGQLQRMVYPIDQPKVNFVMDICKYSRANLLKLGTLTSEKEIYLPVPIQMLDHQQVDYDPQNVGMPSGAAFNATNDALKGIAKEGISVQSVVAAGKSVVENAATIGAVVGAQIIEKSPTISTLAQAMMGYAPNQFLTILLKGPAYKVFELTWKFSPNRPREAEILRKIVQTLNNSMSPGLGPAGAIFTFPDVFRMGFMPNSKYMYKFKPAVLKNFAVNYAPGGMAGFYRPDAATGGLQAPEGMEFRCRFMELEYWLNGDFNDSTDPYNTDGNVPQDVYQFFGINNNNSDSDIPPPA